MNLNHELMDIGRYLRKVNSQCKSRDFVNVFEKKFGKNKLSPETIPRRLRKLRERGIFIPVCARFVIEDKFLNGERKVVARC